MEKIITLKKRPFAAGGRNINYLTGFEHSESNLETSGACTN